MKLWLALRDAWRGWIALVLGREGWQDKFDLTRPGLITALAIFGFFAFLSIAYGSMGGGMPSPLGVMIGLSVQALSLVALLVAVYLTRIMLHSPAPLLALLVPGTYGLVFYIVGGTIVSAIGIEMITLVLAALGYLLYRLGRMAGRWTIGVSIAFAALTVVLLVGMPLTLYMLATPAGSAL